MMESSEETLESAKTRLLIANDDGFKVNFDVNAEIADIDARLGEVDLKIDVLDKEIDRLTNHADKIDYATAVVCGLVAGAIDSLYVGAWDFKDAKAKANKDINKQIEDFAKKCGYEDKGKGLTGAVEFLEKKFPMPGDGAYNGLPGADAVTHSSHHLDDFCHHPTLVGLICNIIRQFTNTAKFHDKNGLVHVAKDIAVNTYEGTLEAGDNPVSKCFCGIVNWFIICAKTCKNAKGHWLSDMAGSSQAVHAGRQGAGVPGSFMSLMKELSGLPIFGSVDKNGKATNAFAESLRRAYQNGIGTGKSQVNLGPFNSLFEGASSKFDARTELAVKKLLGKQAIPVIVNEALVRGAYFVRRLIAELKEKDSIMEVDWLKVLPFGNRTIARMLTIATGTFTACDLLDATVRSGVSNGFNVYNPKFWSDLVLRVNFVGVGRFVVASVTDAGMGIKRGSKQWERIVAMDESLHLMNAKVELKNVQVWTNIEGVHQEVSEVYHGLQVYYSEISGAVHAGRELVDTVEHNRDSIESFNPGLQKELAEIMDEL